jgi:hypothetical protein
MAISNQHTFNMPVHEIIQKASEKAVDDDLNADELQNALKDLNLVMREISNKGHALALVTRASTTTSSGQTDYKMPNKVLDIQHMTARTSVSGSAEITLSKYSNVNFHRLPNKTQTGRPTTYTTERTVSGVNVRMWPVPDAQYTLNYISFNKPSDAIKYTDTLEIDENYLPAVIFGLAYHIGISKKIPLDTLAFIKQNYDEQLSMAFGEDRERVDFEIKPGLSMR